MGGARTPGLVDNLLVIVVGQYWFAEYVGHLNLKLLYAFNKRFD